ncbi:MAG: YjbH domain-containing protein, partial [Chlamydiia bacterium]|nr:YjbH domain-containing protein [Chlamydiia bacterium]
FTGSQYFLNLYYRWFDANLDFKVSGGKFLANDYGVRFQVSRYFDSGLRIYAWYTLTNGGDQINGKTYYDKGVGFSMPLDIFYTHSDRERWGYGMSAWLRDVGVKAKTGRDLYEMITEERQ